MAATDNNMFTDYPDILTTEQLAEMLHIGKSSAYALLKHNQILHVRVGRKYIIPKQAVIGFVQSMCYNHTQIINDGLQSVTKGVIDQ
ncbi:MAG: helix-turn-helix domain-containing protein [Oscillospiraceae bacterium]|nr:helix-turn-helix domain-containing protein [Oscillospiraceae bacterium]